MDEMDFTFKALDELCDSLREVAADFAYLILYDRTNQHRDVSLGRFDANREMLRHRLMRQDPEVDWSDEALDHEAAERACDWVRRTAMRNTFGDRRRRFRVRIYGPKGVQTLASGQFVCTWHGDLDEVDDEALHVAPAEPALPRMPQAQFDGVEDSMTGPGMRALGEYYTQWGNLMLGSFGQLQSLHIQAADRTQRELVDAREQIERLVAALMEVRFEHSKALLDDDRAVREQALRAQLVRESVSQLGDAAKLMLLSKGLTPQMMEVVHMLGSSDELMAALSDPGVRALMSDPKHLSQLAGLLKGFAAQHQQMLAMAQPPQVDGPTEPQPG
ncbi:MAG: hypothetical protein H6739_34685 [Alphaproteobacteria bacterium]|nr:hypothetical protein [Alphaproteobacteria bacterium]